jgi:biotin carboxyl carrier protein
MPNNKFKLVLDGQAYDMERREGMMVVNGQEFTMVRKENSIVVAGNSHTVKLSSASAQVDGINYTVETDGLEDTKTPGSTRTRKSSAAAADSAGALLAVMPGLILKILKKEGDKVEAGETVIVLEAMKMQNDLVAKSAGTITQMNVKQGENVEMRQVLCVIE